jgi:low temperature requirement protein LtrA
VVVVVLEGISSSMPISFSSLYSSFELSAELLSPQFVSVTLFKLFVGVGVFEPLLFSNNRDDEDVDVEHEAELFRLFRLLLFVMFKVESSSLNFSN